LEEKNRGDDEQEMIDSEKRNLMDAQFGRKSRIERKGSKGVNLGIEVQADRASGEGSVKSPRRRRQKTGETSPSTVALYFKLRRKQKGGNTYYLKKGKEKRVAKRAERTSKKVTVGIRLLRLDLCSQHKLYRKKG